MGDINKKVICAVKAILTDSNNRIMILKQKVKNQEIFDLPGGEIEYGDDILSSLKREVYEETNLKIKVIQLIDYWNFFRIKDLSQVVAFVYLCKSKFENINISKNPDKTENIVDYLILSKEEIGSDIYNNMNKDLKRIIWNYYNSLSNN